MLRDARLQDGKGVEPAHGGEQAAPAAEDGCPCLAPAVGVVPVCVFAFWVCRTRMLASVSPWDGGFFSPFGQTNLCVSLQMVARRGMSG